MAEDGSFLPMDGCSCIILPLLTGGRQYEGDNVAVCVFLTIMHHHCMVVIESGNQNS